MSLAYAGEMAAIATAHCWALTALFFAAAGHRIGSLSVNLIRLVMGLLMLSALSGMRRGLPLPTDAGSHAWLWLGVSGLLGFVFGDLCLFRAFVVLGPRLSTLVMSTSPIFTVAAGWMTLGERLSWLDGAGMTLILGGVWWAVLERRPADEPHAHPIKGLLLALGGSVGQALGLVSSKIGMRGYDVIASTQIRVLAGIAGFAIVFFMTGRWHRVWRALRDARALRHTALGAFFGPFLGVSLSLYAVAHTTVGIAATLMATTPIMILPYAILLGRDRVGMGGLLGTLLAVSGVALLFA